MTPTPATLRLTLAGLGALALAMGVGRFAFTPLLPMMEHDGLISVAGGGLLASVHFVGYWVGALLAAKLTVAPGTVLRLSLAAIAVATVGMGVTAELPVWLALRFLAGVCSAFTLVLISNHVIKALQARGRTELQGWVFSGVGAGIMVTGLAVLALMAEGAGSAASWQVIGIVSLLAAIVIALAFGRSFSGQTATPVASDAQRSPLAWTAIIAYGAAGIGYIIPATYLPVMARDIIDAPLIFGWSWPVFGAAAFISTPLAIRAGRFLSNRQIWTASQFVMAAGLCLPALVPHVGAVIIAGICVGGTFMVITMAGMKDAHRVACEADVQRHIAVMTAAFATGQMIGPVVAGWAYAATQSFAAPLLLASAALALTAAALTRRTQKLETVEQ